MTLILRTPSILFFILGSGKDTGYPCKEKQEYSFLDLSLSLSQLPLQGAPYILPRVCGDNKGGIYIYFK